MNNELHNYIGKKDKCDEKDWGKLVDEDRNGDTQVTPWSMDCGGGGDGRHHGGV